MQMLNGYRNHKIHKITGKYWQRKLHLEKCSLSLSFIVQRLPHPNCNALMLRSRYRKGGGTNLCRSKRHPNTVNYFTSTFYLPAMALNVSSSFYLRILLGTAPQPVQLFWKLRFTDARTEKSLFMIIFTYCIEDTISLLPWKLEFQYLI